MREASGLLVIFSDLVVLTWGAYFVIIQLAIYLFVFFSVCILHFNKSLFLRSAWKSPDPRLLFK